MGELSHLQPVTKNNNRPLNKISFQSQQNKRLNSFKRDMQNAINELIIKHKLTNLSGEPIVHLSTQIKLNAIICVCDEAVLGCNLAAVVLTLFHKYLVANCQNEINELMNMQIYIGIFNINNEINNQSNIDDNFNNNVNNILVNNHEIGNDAVHSYFKYI
ncbi:hypothetical protein C1646_768337 [Rhizophagus diaphanus]|nr:hypothetical protein C1646_768337 [Rhizophagus diaphanus] [Rhizophagus sp. MUCL 43196]